VKQNVTLSIEEGLLSQAQVLAAQRHNTLSGFLTSTLETPVESQKTRRDSKHAKFAASQAPEMPIRWGAIGFSLNVDLGGTYVAVFFCYPPPSVFKQSIYTAHDTLSTKTHVPEGEIRRLWTRPYRRGCSSRPDRS
jgi:hypothetical protein